jgi:hypothetical protein
MNFVNLLIFFGLNKSKKQIFNPRTVSGPIRPGATAHRAWWPATHDWLKGWGLAARFGREAVRDVGMPRTTAWWRAHRWLIGGWPAPWSCRGARRGHREGTGQGGRGWSTTERWRGIEAVEDASGGGVRWRGESSDC